MINMWEKLLTKPLQWKSLKEFQSNIINWLFDYENGQIIY